MLRKNNLHKKNIEKGSGSEVFPPPSSRPLSLEEVQHLGDVRLAMPMMGNKLAQEVTVLHSREKSSTSLPYRATYGKNFKILKFLIWAEKGCGVCGNIFNKKRNNKYNNSTSISLQMARVKWISSTS